MPLSTDLASEYAQARLVTTIFGDYASTVTTARNHFAMAYDAQTLVRRVQDLQDKALDDAAIRAKYGLKDVSYWTLSQARKEVAQLASVGDYVQPYCYRPFDFRWVFYHGSICERLRYEVMRHMRGPNVSLLTHRPQSPAEFTFVYCTNLIGDQCVAANKTVGGGNSFQFPLYLYPAGASEGGRQGTLPDTSPSPPGRDGRRANLNPEFVHDLEQRLGLQFVSDGKGDLQKTFGPEDVFNYIYAILHSPTYRQRYAEFLKRDFPRIPLTSNRPLFAALCAKGDELVQLHLMESPLLDSLITTYPVADDNRVENVRYTGPKAEPDGSQTPGRVYVNKKQYFEGVSPALWGFCVGGYQILEKWLKDRKGRALTWQDIEHYQKIAVALNESIRLMAEIDKVIEAHGGWPDAFMNPEDAATK